MATIPEKPQTNLEQYLNRIATGDGEYPAKPRTNVEQYLNYIIENGTGGGELVTELPAEGKEGKLYVLVDDATAPTKAYGVYTYAGGQYIVIAQPIDQSVQKVTTLPTEGQEGVLYYLETSADTYDLYRWINNEWIKVDSDIILYSQEGSNVDGAMTQKAVTDALNDKQNVLTAGDSIDITNDIISATNTGKARVLTTADYNWPTNNPDSIALWLLEPGLYQLDTDVNYRFESSSRRGGSNDVFLIGKVTSNTHIIPAYTMHYQADTHKTRSALVSLHDDGSSFSVDYQAYLISNLTSTNDTLPLAASQGKVLKGLIDENLGKARTLTTADYNYPTSNPNRIAMWLLEPGMYVNSNSVRWQAASSVMSVQQIAATHLIEEDQNFKYICSQVGLGFDVVVAVPSSGAYANNYSFVTSDKIKNNLTTTASGNVLDARQGKILKDLIDSIAIRKAGAPTASTAGQVGTLYENTTNGALYICTTVSGSTYTWKKVALYEDLPTTLTDEQYEALWSTPNALNNYLETIVSGQGV